MILDKTDDFLIERKKGKISRCTNEPHYHPYFEMIYLVSGEGNCCLQHNIYKLGKGNLIMIPAGEIHKTTYTIGGIHDRIIVDFTESMINTLYEELGEEKVNAALKRGVISIPDKRRSYVIDIFEKLLFENSHIDVMSKCFIRNYLQELLLFLIRFQEHGSTVVKEMDVTNGIIQNAATYIYHNYDKNITLNKVAGMNNISPSYLSKKFKEITGFGFKEYVMNVRVKEAARQLLETEKTITEIAISCGFNDSNYFGDAFKHIKGISPMKYRKSKGAI
ncbi:MAG: helix-turn-helix domain-containing protein [Lachnospiraceae bacterium]|nr:helix-turn-helix domain-containing protein [Lachnospiraceae bacterium]